MWVKLTPAEIAEAGRKRQRERIRLPIFIGCSLCGISLLCSSGLFAKIQERHIYLPRGNANAGPLLEQMGPLPRAVVFGSIGALIFYFLLSRPGKSTMICIKCGETKYADGSVTCKCGGHFEDMRSLKWLED